jgi:hypothetical protein
LTLRRFSIPVEKYNIVLCYIMKRPHKHSDGRYHVNNKKYPILIGSRIQVWNQTAYKTTGGLTRKQLMMNRWNRIVSAKKHRTAKKEKRLEKHGYFAKKGKFGYVRRTMKRGGTGVSFNDSKLASPDN